jgi:hypothetical protein
MLAQALQSHRSPSLLAVAFSAGGDGGRRSTALDRVAQIAERKYCRAQARPFRLGFPRKVPVFPICSPAAL